MGKPDLSNLPEFRQSIPLQIRFNDIDILGHVNNAVQLSYFDLGRLRYFEHIFEVPTDWNEISVVIASIKVDYFSPITLGEKIEVATSVTVLGNKSIEMVQTIRLSEEGTIKTLAQTILSGYCPQVRKTVEIPVEWKSRIEGYEKVIRYKYSG